MTPRHRSQAASAHRRAAVPVIRLVLALGSLIGTAAAETVAEGVARLEPLLGVYQGEGSCWTERDGERHDLVELQTWVRGSLVDNGLAIRLQTFAVADLDPVSQVHVAYVSYDPQARVYRGISIGNGTLTVESVLKDGVLENQPQGFPGFVSGWDHIHLDEDDGWRQEGAYQMDDGSVFRFEGRYVRVPADGEE